MSETTDFQKRYQTSDGKHMSERAVQELRAQAELTARATADAIAADSPDARLARGQQHIGDFIRGDRTAKRAKVNERVLSRMNHKPPKI